MFKNLKQNLALFLFSLPFAGVGVGMLLFSVLPSIVDWQTMKSWRPVSAEVLHSELKVNRGDDGDTYKAMARYRYEFNNRSYEHDRVAINSSADNVGNFQKNLGTLLSRAVRQGQPITVWVNPQDPAQAIVNRDLRLGLLGFSMIFVLVFGGVGFGMMAWAFLAKTEETFHPDRAEKPWLGRREWASDTLTGNTKAGLWGTWIFALFWNLISSFLRFLIPEELGKGNYMVLVAGVFPLVGLGILVLAIRKTLEWRRFGVISVKLDPYPGAIGGHVGGTLDVPLAFNPEHRFPVSLSCVYSYESGSGKNRSRHETIKWQVQGFAQTKSSAVGTRLGFRFSVPDNLPTSEPPGDAYHFWRLHITADLPGVDLDRSFELPVFATAEQSRFQHDDSGAHVLMVDYQAEMIESVLDMRQIPGGVELNFPMWRHFKMKFGWVVMGGIFAGIGIFLWHGGAADFMATGFTLLGGIPMLWALYSLTNSLYVRMDRDGIVKVRKLLGVVIHKESCAANQVVGLSAHQSYSMTSNREKTDFFTIKAHTQSGKKLTIAESLKGYHAAQQALEAIALMSGYSIKSAKIFE